MEVWQAVILGLVQGLTEFLPVSSSGHLVFFQRVLNVDLENIDLIFDIMLHLGTLVAVCAIFWRDILDLFKKPFKTLLYLIVATIPAGVAGLIFDDMIEEHIYKGAYVGIFLAVGFVLTAALLFATEIVAKKRENTLPLCWRVTVSMGVGQAVAILPGLSRSGTTICVGTFAGGNREEVAKFSFLMSIPIILGSFLVSLVKGLYKGEIQNSFAAAPASFGWSIALGVIVAAVSGLFAIKVMLAAIKKANYKWFSLYLVLIAIACIVLQCIGFFN
jgi:undecaprenyl-diphosphatase